MAARHNRTDRGKVLRLACWNADGVRGRKLELEYFLNQHGVDVMAMESQILEILLAYVKQGRKSCKLRDMHGRERPT
jgi:hypothetical protein